jgi:isopenicillin-N epimerase
MTFPVERICESLRRQDLRILVDGAHAIGQIPLDVSAIDCDFYTTNPHKWFYAPTGTGLIYARDRALMPAIVSHRANDPFPIPFYYAGSRDYSAWLSIPSALAFFESLDAVAMRAHATDLLDQADTQLGALGIHPVRQNGPLMMRTYLVPQSREANMADGQRLKQQLWDNARLLVFSIVWEGQLLIRLSAAPYADSEDVDVLCRELRSRGWPGK